MARSGANRPVERLFRAQPAPRRRLLTDRVVVIHGASGSHQIALPAARQLQLAGLLAVLVIWVVAATALVLQHDATAPHAAPLRAELAPARPTASPDATSDVANRLAQAEGRADAMAAEAQARADAEDQARQMNAALTVELAATQAMLSQARQAQTTLAAQLEAPARSETSTIERALARTGLDVDHLLSSDQLAANRGQGGPLLPLALGRGDDSPASLALNRAAAMLDRLERLHRLLGELPVGTPTERVEISSPFGLRIDPVSHLAALHPGIDLRNEIGSAVRVTAPGLVTAAGREGDYGLIIEVQHAFGVSTRYAHLSRSVVQPGQSVAAGTVIGFTGNSGRSTGAHLHYEVRVNNVPRNPLPFLEISRSGPAQ